MRVRQFRLSDADALAIVFHRSVREGGLRHYSPEQVEAWSPAPPSADAFVRRADDRAMFVAIDYRDQPIGYADLGPDGYIDHFYCHPDRIGTGVGPALYAALEDAAVSAGIAVLSVDASEGARRLFERRGFRIEGRQDLAINGVAIHNYRMSKVLIVHPPLMLTSRDAGDVAGLYARCADYFLLQDGELATAADAAELFSDVPEGKSIADQTVFGWQDNDGLYAVAAILRDYPSDGIWYLGFMIVDAAKRGQGIGGSIHEAVEQWVKAHGAQEMRLSVLEVNHAAERFWRSLGYNELRRVGPDVFKVLSHRRIELSRSLRGEA